MSDTGAPAAFDFAVRQPSQRTAGLIAGMSGYRETALGRFCQRKTAPLRLPLIISLGTPFLIAFGRDPNHADRQRSFAAGLNVGPVHIQSDGGAECVQVDFTPHGAYRFFGGAVVDLAARMIRFHQACRLAQTGATPSWAGVAAESGFADQAHLVREFVSLAGEPPTAWARRLALTDSRLTRPDQLSPDW